MPSLTKLCLAGLSLASTIFAAPRFTHDRRDIIERDGVTYNVFEHAATGTRMEFVNNSGICETTPGVNQYSGYLSVGNNMNMWFWFFEARNSPATAPLAAWFNGGPGCSSMIGLFQENGPCHFTGGSSTPSLNPYSWNNYANMLYIDQPIGVGFSYGTDDVTSSTTAAPEVWKLIQAFYAQFPQYESRDFGIFTESYGGHYGPTFAQYIQSQNAAISKGTVTGEKINIVALGINNGWFDGLLQYPAYIDYSYNKTLNSYNQIITTQSRYNSYMNTFKTQCQPALQQCKSSGSNSDCSKAVNTCYNGIEGPISQLKDFDVYDVREPSNDPYPPATYQNYLASSAVTSKIGAKHAYTECDDTSYNQFSSTGDNSRSTLPALQSVIQSGINVMVWAGDADWICNWVGNYAVANAVSYSQSSTFQSKGLAPYTVNGKQYGTFKSAGNFNFLRVFGAGHEVPYYQPEVSLQAFTQIMKKQALSST